MFTVTIYILAIVLLFEATSMGWRFMLTRFLVDLPGIALIAYATEKLMNDSEKKYIYDNATTMD
ncbi:MAG: hypothetical protein ACM3ZR_12560 [Pseudomonadota bacterium]